MGSRIPYIGSRTIDKVSSNPLGVLSIVSQTMSLLIPASLMRHGSKMKSPSACLYALGSEAREDMACPLSMDEAHELEKMTRGQNAPLWPEERRERITASWLGDVVLRKAAATEKFLSSLVKLGNHSTRYINKGDDNEVNAASKYKELRGVEVHPVGLCVNPGTLFLGASPNSFVWDKRNEFGLVEVKYPASNGGGANCAASHPAMCLSLGKGS